MQCRARGWVWGGQGEGGTRRGEGGVGQDGLGPGGENSAMPAHAVS